ncbi:3-phosphoshikimate 1-carboxyvinyltransferase [Woeseia oceani]|uniref:3-phosphoshikimate 1-carboxyvinyltransferase n=1 Tax=Woeseia oceani TaxID=1548547 RepID=A0A193LG73_9GAMM|nr:3-phosphoshikimate 1-carboxyvinyltransferase [Woeseia oceani]
MHYLVSPSAVGNGSLRVPGDKSISHRALMFGAIAEGQTRASGFLNGADCLATLAALRSLGVNIEESADHSVVITGVGLHGMRAPAIDLDLGNSGTAMRLFCGLLAGQSFSSTLCGDESLSGRPMGRVVEPLMRMGAEIHSADGRPPLKIVGGNQLTGIDYAMPVASAQVKSAILLAGLYAHGATSVLEPAVSRDHTERMLTAMGATVYRDAERVSILPGSAMRGIDIVVPGDLSSATFPMLAALIADNSCVMLENVGVNPTRAGVITILRQMGADIRLHNERRCGDEPVADLEIRSSKLRAITLDPALVPLAIDEFPALFVAAACAEGTTEFSGLAELRVKESDRISAMADGLRVLGIRLEEQPDGIRISGGPIGSGTVQSHSDHRIAMAFAVAASRANDTVRIEDVANVNTSFPGFVDQLQSIGVDIIQGGVAGS